MEDVNLRVVPHDREHNCALGLLLSGVLRHRVGEERVQFLPKLPFVPLGISPHRHADLPMKTGASCSTLAISTRRPSGVLALGGSVEVG